MVATPGNKLGSVERDSDMGHEMFINIWLEQILNSLFPLKGSIDVKIQGCQRSCIHLRMGLLLGGGTWGGGEGRCRGGGGAGGRGTARTAPPSPPPASARAAP